MFSFTVSCTSFSKFAESNSIKSGEYYKGDYYYKYTNTSLGISMLQFGDFRYAQKKNEYEKLVEGTVPFPGRNKILYANTTDMHNPDVVEYFFDISLREKKKYPDGFYMKTINCNDKDKVTLVLSKNTPKEDAEFLLDQFKCIE